MLQRIRPAHASSPSMEPSSSRRRATLVTARFSKTGEIWTPSPETPGDAVLSHAGDPRFGVASPPMFSTLKDCSSKAAVASDPSSAPTGSRSLPPIAATHLTRATCADLQGDSVGKI